MRRPGVRSTVRHLVVAAVHAIGYALVWLVLWVAIPAFVLQWSPVVLTGDSMQPGLSAGDVVLTSDHSGAGLGAGTVIVFEDPGAGGLTTHRIVEVTEAGLYRTKGDGSASPDSTLVAPRDVRGVGRLAVPLIGLPLAWYRTGNSAALVVLAAAVLCLLAGRVVAAVRARQKFDVEGEEAQSPTPVVDPVPAGTPTSEWADVRDLLRRNRRHSPLTRLAALVDAARWIPRPVLDGEASGEPGLASAPDAVPNRGPEDELRLPSSMARAAVLLLVVGAMALVLVMAPVRVASAQFIGITGPGGASVTTDTLDPPTGLGADTSTAGQIDLTWTPTVDGYATGYRIYRSETSGSGYALVDTVLGAGSTGYSDVFTPTKRTYYYVVETHYAGWSSVSSNEATANVGYDGIIRATGGLVSYWRLGLTTTTSIAPDDWGPSDGTPSGGFTPGVGGAIVGDSDTAANFTGSGDVNAGNHSSLQLNSGTVEAWIRTSNAGNGYREIVSKEGVYYLAARDNVLGVYDDGSGRWRSSGVSIDDNAWHHVVLRYQSGVSNGTQIYLDGTLVLTTTITAVGQGQPVHIGSWYGGTEFWNGRIDEVAIYNTLLSPATIGVHHQSGITP